MRIVCNQRHPPASDERHLALVRGLDGVDGFNKALDICHSEAALLSNDIPWHDSISIG